jgi:acyl-CoA synthetase (AMP-forming)/AMP-acid ligase II
MTSDRLEGESSNASDYVSGDPINAFDLDGAMSVPGTPTTLVDVLHAAPGDRLAVVDPAAAEDGAITYDSLRQRVADLAGSLAASGIAPGDRVAIALPNGLPVLVAILAASAAATAAPLNPAYRYDELCFYLRDTGARLIILPEDGAEDARRAAADCGISVATVESFAAGGSSGRAPAPEPVPEDVALGLHTSGSTGRPKRVPLRHANLTVSVANVVGTYQLTPGDVSLCVMPLFHVHGLVASALATFASAGTVVVPPAFSPFSFWRLVRTHGVTWYSAVPTIHQLLLARLGAERPDGAEQLRFIRSCSAALPPAVMAQLESGFGVAVLEAYGMTEAAHQMASNPLPPGTRKPGTVGPGTGVRIGILGADGTELPAGQPGEVVIAGRNVIDGYEDNPAANADSFTAGWFRTGDQGVIDDDDGYLRLTGRIKELINRGGEKIAPREIDDVLLSHPAVAEAVAFGVPHPVWGEQVAAAVVLRRPVAEAELLAWCRDRLAGFKCPGQLHVVEAIPRTATGKIQRLSVAARFASDRA